MLNRSKRNNFEQRLDLVVIAENILPNTRILDLGCGDGELLHYLKTTKNISGTGIEKSQEKILKCVKIGVPVVHGDLNDGLAEFPNKSFDYVILSQTLQAVERPDIVLKDMARIGKKAIVSFINIGYLTCRMQIMFHGRMPLTSTLPALWYETDNIHLGTIKDFRTLCHVVGLRIFKEIPLSESFIPLCRIWPNLFAQTCVFIISE